jgi:hypothetical protein
MVPVEPVVSSFVTTFNPEPEPEPEPRGAGCCVADFAAAGAANMSCNVDTAAGCAVPALVVAPDVVVLVAAAEPPAAIIAAAAAPVALIDVRGRALAIDPARLPRTPPVLAGAVIAGVAVAGAGATAPAACATKDGRGALVARATAGCGAVPAEVEVVEAGNAAANGALPFFFSKN